jgi:hypothetical protein
MWVIQNKKLLHLPDDVPLPPGSLRVNPPDEFLLRPEEYTVTEKAVLKRSEADLRKRQSQQPVLKLSQEEIAILKKLSKKKKL